MKPHLQHLPVTEFDSVSYLIQYWTHDGEKAWFARAWSILRKYGLTYFMDDFSKCICLMRGLALARSLRHFMMYYDEGSDPREFDYTLQNLGISENQEHAFIAFLAKEDIEDILMEQYDIVVSTIRNYLGDDDVSIYRFYTKSRVPRREQSRFFDEDLSISNMQAYGWVAEGCFYL